MFYVLLNACLDIIRLRAFYDDFFVLIRRLRFIFGFCFRLNLLVLIFNLCCSARGCKVHDRLGSLRFKLGGEEQHISSVDKLANLLASHDNPFFVHICCA